MDHITRIREMESILNAGREAMDELEKAIGRLNAMRDGFSALYAYYGSEEWFDHRDMDARGELPEGLSRGVLTEDPVFDLLTDQFRLCEALDLFCRADLPESEEA